MAGRPRLKRNERRVRAPLPPGNNGLEALEANLEGWRRTNPLSQNEEVELRGIEREEQEAREAERREIALRERPTRRRNKGRTQNPFAAADAVEAVAVVGSGGGSSSSRRLTHFLLPPRLLCVADAVTDDIYL